MCSGRGDLAKMTTEDNFEVHLEVSRALSQHVTWTNGQAHNHPLLTRVDKKPNWSIFQGIVSLTGNESHAGAGQLDKYSRMLALQ